MFRCRDDRDTAAAGGTLRRWLFGGVGVGVLLGCSGIVGPTGPLGFLCPPGTTKHTDQPGKGEVVWPDTSVKTCTNSDDQRIGPHLEEWPDGTVAAEGHWSNGKKDGTWTRWNPDGSFAGRSTWKDGVEDGPRWEVSADGRIFEVVFRDGQAEDWRSLPRATAVPEWLDGRKVDGVRYQDRPAPPDE